MPGRPADTPPEVRFPCLTTHSAPIAPLFSFKFVSQVRSNFAVSCFCALSGWPGALFCRFRSAEPGRCRRFQPPDCPYFAGKSPFATLRPDSGLAAPALDAADNDDQFILFSPI